MPNLIISILYFSIKCLVDENWEIIEIIHRCDFLKLLKIKSYFKS